MITPPSTWRVYVPGANAGLIPPRWQLTWLFERSQSVLGRGGPLGWPGWCVILSGWSSCREPAARLPNWLFEGHQPGIIPMPARARRPGEFRDACSSPGAMAAGKSGGGGGRFWRHRRKFLTYLLSHDPL